MMTFGVSYGNGNDGVSQLFPSFYVTVDPDEAYNLARLAMLSTFKPGNGVRWAKANVEVDGEAEYTIQAVILDPPGSPDWSEHNGAWQICEVFPVQEDDIRDGKPVYDSLNAAFGKAFVKRHKE